MRVTTFAPYPEVGPSTRYRLVQLAEPLRARGVELELRPYVTTDAYLRLRGAHAVAKAAALVRGWARRRSEIASLDREGVTLVHRELAPMLNGPLASGLERRVPFIYDFDDAVYLPPAGGDPLLRPFRRPSRDTGRFCAAAAAVMAGNAHLAGWASEARGTSRGVHVVPTVVDTDRFRPAPQNPSGGRPVVGWVGTSTTLPYLEALDPVLTRLRRVRDFEVRVVADSAPDLAVEHTFERWTPSREVSVVQDLDIGLYPLPDDPWTRGKCGFKAIQYMACGVTVVASPVGMLSDLVEDGHTGFLADSPDAWERVLLQLLDEPDLRRRTAANGRDRVVSSYSVDAVADRVASILLDAAAHAPTAGGSA